MPKKKAAPKKKVKTKKKVLKGAAKTSKLRSSLSKYKKSTY